MGEWIIMDYLCVRVHIYILYELLITYNLGCICKRSGLGVMAGKTEMIESISRDWEYRQEVTADKCSQRIHYLPEWKLGFRNPSWGARSEIGFRMGTRLFSNGNQSFSINQWKSSTEDVGNSACKLAAARPSHCLQTWGQSFLR